MLRCSVAAADNGQVCSLSRHHQVSRGHSLLWAIPWGYFLSTVCLLRCRLAACTATGKSVTDLMVMCGIGSIAWKSARQATVSRSTAESEYIAAGEVAKELQYAHQLAPDLGLLPGCVPVGCDNSAALSLVEDPLSAARAKHIDIIYHHVWHRVKML
jgi:hypothetical protein